MSKRPVDADLGMVSMRLGEAESAPAAATAQPDHADIRRLDAILSRQPNRRQAGHGSQEQPTPMELMAQLDPEGGEQARQLCREIEMLWTGDGSVSRREVRIKLRREVLPDTWLRLYEEGGRLHIEMTAGAEGTRRWLTSELRRLALMLGERLTQPFRLIIVEPHQVDPTVLDWPQGQCQ
jgi:hypothetical protein